MSTTRQEIMALLSQGECGAKSISKILRLSEKEVYQHLSHIDRSLKSQNRRLRTIPARCLECGYTFDISTTILGIFLSGLRVIV